MAQVSYDDEDQGSHEDKEAETNPSRIPLTKSLFSTATDSHKKRRKLQGWRFGVACCSGAATLVLLLNVILTVWAATHFGPSIGDGVGTAYMGSCDTVTRWSVGLHIVINGFSAILLSASNYTMQCLNAPTRKEIDKAHAKGKWLDVGVASLRNMPWIRWRRVALWWLLACSSVPIHLVYNSAIFKTIEANNYLVAVVNEDFLRGDAFYNYYAVWIDNDGYQLPFDYDLRAVQKNISSNAAYKNGSLWERLDNSRCMAEYATSYVSGRTNVFAITSKTSAMPNQTAFWEQMVFVPSLYTDYPPYNWICTNSTGGIPIDCDVAQQRQDAANWNMAGLEIEYCLSQIVPAHCKLQFSTTILATVIAMNLCKSLTMLLTLFRGKEAPLVTMGDALASFLERPDDSTQGRCLMGKRDIDNGPLRWTSRGHPHRPVRQPLPVTYSKPSHPRWYASVSIDRWIITMILVSAALIGALVLLIIGRDYLQTRLGAGQSVFDLGFGAVDSRALIVSTLPQIGTSALLADVLIANVPQLICSVLYFAYNALFTGMLLCYEYSQYALAGRNKSLRVTNPSGQQRSTYFLQLPYKYSIPLIIGSAVLHWLISQSIFLVKVTVLQDSSYDESHLGYSCLPILCTIIIGGLMLLIPLGLGFRRLAPHMPVAGSCSAALSAACHRPKQDTDAAYQSVRWGAVSAGDNEEIGHCCFTSEDVHAPTPGMMYA